MSAPEPAPVLDRIEDFAPLLAPHARLMGLDLGTKTIGLALSDVMRSVASPFQTLKRRKFSLDAAELLQLAQAHEAGGFVLGLPVNMNGTEGPRAQSTRAFARNLSGLTDLPILLWDERWSTAAVTRTLLEADASRKRRGELVDKLAAAYILQGALDRLRGLAAEQSGDPE
ncbi:MAG: Holliday junction resolvase RuvX [Alphaproteobacteria bacterium]